MFHPSKTRRTTRFPLLCAALLAGCAADTGFDPREGAIDDGVAVTEEAFPGESGPVESRQLTVNGVTDQFEFEVVRNTRVYQGDVVLGAHDPEAESESAPEDDDADAVPDDIANPPPYEPDATLNTADGTVEPDLATSTEALTARAAASMWPRGRVYFRIARDLPNRARVWDAIRHWHAHTRIRFVRRTNQAAYVTFRRGTGCSAEIGRTGTRQYVWLANACTTGATIHEIGHTVGLWHEQSRTDRNDHVRILWDNIQPGMRHNFQTYAQQGVDGRNIGRYDVNSIMHYGSTYFSRNGRPTITTLSGGRISGQRQRLSTRDIAGIRSIYAQ